MPQGLQKHITLTNLNIRESIAILISKLFLTDLLFAAIVIGFYIAMVVGTDLVNYNQANSYLFIFVFIILGLIKVFINAYVILDWLNEYYEITPETIVHKHGIIFKKQEHYRISNLRRMIVNDNFMGEILNFATITLYDIRLNKYLDMYLIHNAKRYAKVIKQLKPDVEIGADRTWAPFMNEDDEKELGAEQ